MFTSFEVDLSAVGVFDRGVVFILAKRKKINEREKARRSLRVSEPQNDFERIG
jgi:hypothetical protein